MTSRRRSQLSNYPSDTESLNAKDLIYVIRKHSLHSQTKGEDNLQIIEGKIKKHSVAAEKEFIDGNGIWSIGNVQETNAERTHDLLTNRMNEEVMTARTSDDDLEKNEFAILKPSKLQHVAEEEHHRSSHYLNKRLPWYCESSSPIKWFKEFSNDQLPKVHYNQRMIEQPHQQHPQQQPQHPPQYQQQQQQMNKNDQPLINLESNGYAMDYNNFDSNSFQTYVKSHGYSTKETAPKQVKTQVPSRQDHLRFVDQLNPEQTIRYRSNQSSMGTISKPQSTQNHYQPFQPNMMSDHQTMQSSYAPKQQWHKLSIPHVQPHHLNSHLNSPKIWGSSRSSYGGRRSYTNKSRFKFNPFNKFYKPRSSNYAGLNEMFADSSVPGVREICHSDGYFRKFIWMIAFVTFSFLALNDIQQLLSDFYSYPITVDMRLKESRKLPFPAVTICNLNIVRYSALCNSTLNVSMPVELQEKLCGTNLSQMKNTSIEDINDILPDSDQTQSTKPPFDDYLNYDDELPNEQTSGPETTIHPKNKKPGRPMKPTNRPKPKKQGRRQKRSPSASGTGSKSHPGTVPNINSNSNLNKASPSPPEVNPEIEMFDLTEREEKELQENLTTWLAVMANKNKNLTFTLGHQFDDMVLRCTIKSANCTHPNSFLSSFTPTEGNCYTFVAKTNMNPTTHTHNSTTFSSSVVETSTTPLSTTERTETTEPPSSPSHTVHGSTTTDSIKINPPLQAELTTGTPPDLTTKITLPPDIRDSANINSGHHQVETILAGPDHGLELVINLEKPEYLPGTSQIGALVMLHSPDDFGISASEAIMVSPECATYIGLKMVRISRLPAPYPEQCIDVWPKGLQRKSMLNVSYSQQACIKICLQKTIQTRCKCQSAFLEQVEFNGTDFRICDTRKRNTRRCVEEVMLRPENKLEDCKCPPRCQVIQYEKTVSVARWPTREDRVSFDRYRGAKDVNISNVAKVVVYFQTMTLQEVTQQAAWTTAKLFSSLGGFLGMYVGFSALSLFEVFEIMGRRLYYGMTRRAPRFKAVAQAVLSAIIAKNQLQRRQEMNNLNNMNNLA